MPVFDDRFAHRTWNATKLLLKQLTNVNRTDSLEPSGRSIFDLNERQQNIQHILLDAQYTKAKVYMENNKYKVDIEEITPRSIKCLDSLETYLNARNQAINGACSDRNVTDTLKTLVNTTTLQHDFETLKKTIQSEQIKNEKIGLFSLVNELFILRSGTDQRPGPKKILEEQLNSDISAIDSTKLDHDSKQKIKDALKTSHETAFKAFEDTMNAEIKTELNRARFENSRLALVKLWQEKGSEDMKKQLEQAIANSKKDAPGKVTLTTLGANPDEGDRTDFKAALGQIKQFKTLSGLQVTQSKPGSFQIQFPGRFNVFYHNDLQDNVAADLELLALSIKASGYSEITFTFNGSNTEDIHLLARKAYEAAIKQGFKGGKDGQIHFKVNGKVMNLFDEIDKDNKTTKGVFANEHDMKQYKKDDDVEQQMRNNEIKDLSINATDTFKRFKAELEAKKQSSSAVEITGEETLNNAQKTESLIAEGAGAPHNK